MNNVLISSLPADGRISASDVLSAGSTGLAKMFPNPADLKIVVSAYMKGLKAAWIWSIALAGVSFLVSLAAERKSVRLDHVKREPRRKLQRRLRLLEPACPKPCWIWRASNLADPSNSRSRNSRIAASVWGVPNRAKSPRLSQESLLPQTRVIKMANKVQSTGETI